MRHSTSAERVAFGGSSHLRYGSEMPLLVSLLMPTVRPLAFLVSQDAYDEGIADLVAMSGALRTLDPHLHGANISVAYSPDPAGHPMLQDKWTGHPTARECGVLIFTADLKAFADAFRSELERDGRLRSMQEVDALVASCCCENFEFEVSNLLLLANIQRPGAITTTAGFGYFNDKYVGSTGAFHAEDWYRAPMAAEKYRWPHLEPGSVAQAWAWFAEVSCIEDGMARGPVGRAVAALTYITAGNANSESSLNLVWVLLALESLYCTGTVGLREQLVAKSELILGPRFENKRAFGAMYDFRSRLLHGDMDLPLRYSHFNAVPDFKRHYDDLDDFEGLGLAALVATLQTMIKNNWRGLDFGYRAQGIPMPPPETTD